MQGGRKWRIWITTRNTWISQRHAITNENQWTSKKETQMKIWRCHVPLATRLVMEDIDAHVKKREQRWKVKIFTGKGRIWTKRHHLSHKPNVMKRNTSKWIQKETHVTIKHMARLFSRLQSNSFEVSPNSTHKIIQHTSLEHSCITMCCLAVHKPASGVYIATTRFQHSHLL